MNQPTATVCPADVLRIVARDFREDQRATVIALLERYGLEAYEREADRVRAAVLKNADGDVEAVRREVESAKMDYRDTLLAAEYPAHSRRMKWHDREEEEAAMRRDWDQYRSWFERS